MDERNNLLFEIKFIGKDYTNIYDCLPDFRFEYTHDTEMDKKLNEFINKVCSCMYVNRKKHDKRSNGKLLEEGFLNKNEVFGKIKDELLVVKKGDILDVLRCQLTKILQAKEGAVLGEDLSLINELDTVITKIESLINILEDNNYKIEIVETIEKEKLVYFEVSKPSREELNEIFDNQDLVEDLITKFEGDYGVSTIEKKLNNSSFLNLYVKFTNDVNLLENEKLIVGCRQDREVPLKEKDCKLYSKFENCHQFGNLVGTIRKEYSIYEFSKVYKEFLDEDAIEAINKVLDYDKKIAITVQIRSRLDGDYDKPYFLLEMLTHGNISFNDSEVPSNKETAALLDCLLLFRLKQYLLKAYGKGIYRTYQTFSENKPKLKGSIDFSTHIKMNMGMENGKIASVYREKSADNYLNHLILEAYDELKSKYYDLVVNNFDKKYKSNEVINILRNETKDHKYKRSILMRKCETPISHPYFTEYEELRKVCFNILRGEGASLLTGGDDKVAGILYYVPDLWEEYLESKMNHPNLSSQDEIMVLCNKDREYKNKFRPDFVFRNYLDKPFMILDAKYKPGWIKVHRNSSFGNYKEDYVECIRNMNAINAYATGVIFPYIDSEKIDEYEKKIIMHSISEYNKLTSFYTVPIRIPQQNSSGKGSAQDKFVKWQKELTDCIKEQMGILENIIDCEEKKFAILDDLIKKAEETDLEDYYKARQEAKCIVWE